MKSVILIILLTLSLLSWADEPLMTTPFKCIVDYSGGVNHAQDSQDAGAFKISGEEFRLVPRASMPAKFIEVWDEYDFKQAKANKIIGGGVWEEFTYFVRQTSDDPQQETSWAACFLTSEVSGANRMVCGTEDKRTGSLFRMNLDTKKFVYAYLGSWDSPPLREGYYGDSSMFMFGQCRPYYD
ncbi:MAG: hypothetical protein ACJ0RG_03255 [Candidatus Azotimanducaceae bacterium]